jgi:bifunctional non-homologous end joining protein LigD
VKIGNHDVKLTSQGKVLFPKRDFTKGDLVDYYRKVADVILPHLKDRAVTLQRFPGGIGRNGFFQKEAGEHFPDWIRRAELPKEKGTVHYTLIDDEAGLAYLANQGAVTLHVSLSRVDKPDHPDRLVFDLDPGEAAFPQVQKAAGLLCEAFETLEMPAFVQATGSSGLHVASPLDRSADFDRVRAFARDLAERLAGRHGDLLTVEQRKDKRAGRIFLDYLRNAYGQTHVCPYSVRAKPGAPVAAPLDWDEALEDGLGPQDYDILSMPRRLGHKPDPWDFMDRRTVALEAVAARIDRLD